MPRRKLVFLLAAFVLIGALAAVNFGVLERWVIEPREEKERKRQQAQAASWAEIQRLEDQYHAELVGKDEQAVVTRLGQPTEKIDREFASTGRNHPLWRYTSPPLEISFNRGVVDLVRYKGAGPPSE
jgi:hypothetical protein